MLKAKLVQDKTRKGFRAIVQHDKSNNQFFPSYPNSAEYVEIEDAPNYMIKLRLQRILKELGVENPVINDTHKLSLKFYKELVSNPLEENQLVGNLAYNETSVGAKFFVITKASNDSKG